MIEKEERESIIAEAVERALLALPQVVGSLIQEQSAMNKMASKYFNDNAEFKSHKDIFASVVESLESANPGKDYGEILDEATPIIKRRIEEFKKMDLKNVSKPTTIEVSVGADHGEL